jgi:hypothetical protein
MDEAVGKIQSGSLKTTEAFNTMTFNNPNAKFTYNLQQFTYKFTNMVRSVWGGFVATRLSAL